MPSYQNNPFQVAKLLQKGVPTYLYGGFSYSTGNTKLALSSVTIASNVATVVATIINGPAPVVGALISITNSTSGTGEFNVNRVALASVSVANDNVTWTLTFALTGANLSTASDAGTVIVEPAETSETLANGASIAVCVQAPEGDSQFTLPVSITFPTLPTAATVTLQSAIRNVDSEFTAVGSPLAVVAASTQTVGPFNQVAWQRGYFYRLLCSGVTGSGKIVAKIG